MIPSSIVQAWSAVLLVVELVINHSSVMSLAASLMYVKTVRLGGSVLKAFRHGRLVVMQV